MADLPKPTLSSGIVKLVLSGDSIIVRGVPKGGPPPEKQLNLAGITAPRLARRPGPGGEATADEPGAWAAREFLRKKLVGQQVFFTVDYTIPSSGREFGTVYIGSGPGAENIAHTLVREGYVRVREGRRSEDAADPAVQAITAMDANNQELKKGVYSPDAAVRPIDWHLADAHKLCETNKGKLIPAIIEHVQNGCQVRAFLLLGGGFQSAMISLTGIRTPSTRKNDAGQYVEEEYSAESKFFVEERILQRDVHVVLEGVEGGGSNPKLLATVHHPRGNISEFLLRQGFARIVDWSFTNVTVGRDGLRAAELEAKQLKRRIWKSYVPSIGVPADQRTFIGTVVEVINPERLVVLKADGERKEVTLASVRQPRKNAAASAKVAAAKQKAAAAAAAADGSKAAGDADGGAAAPDARPRRGKPLYEVPLMFEAREFLRRLLVGKQAEFNVDFIKPAEDRYPEKHCVTIKYGGKNVAEELIRKGLATALRHGQFDDARSTSYDKLLDAEKAAEEARLGVHGLKDGGEPMYVSEINSKIAGERLVTALQSKRSPSAIVEYVQSGSKMRVYIARDTCTVSVLIAGISCPRTGFKGEEGEPYSEEARELVKKLALQRDVSITPYDTDKRGNMIASIEVGGTDIAEALCEEGLASMHFSASRYGSIEPSLAEAEARAKAAKKNLWTSYDPAAEAAAADARRAARSGSTGGDGGDDAGGRRERTKTYKPCTVVFVEDAVTFHATYKDEAAAAKLDDVMGKLAAGKASYTEHKPKKGEMVAAKFEDGEYYRAKICRAPNAEDPNYEVKFVDYGNTGLVAPKDVSKLPDAVAAIELEPQAVAMKFALLKPPPADYMQEATELLNGGICGREYSASEEYQGRDGDWVAVQLVDEESKDDIALTMLQYGYATVNPRKERGALGELQKTYAAEEAAAKSAHTGMWVYGDVTEDPKDI